MFWVAHLGFQWPLVREVLLKSKPIELDPLEIHSHDIESKQISDIIIAGKELNHSFIINIGSNKGIKNGMAVLDRKNFVGNYLSQRFLYKS